MVPLYRGRTLVSGRDLEVSPKPMTPRSLIEPGEVHYVSMQTYKIMIGHLPRGSDPIDSDIQGLRYPKIQIFMGSDIQGFRYPKIQVSMGSNIQGFRYPKVQ